MEGSTVTLATLASLASSIAEAAEWLWGVFTDLINTIASNNLLLWPVVFAIVAGVTGLAIKVIRRFGLKGRR
ncbi:MAG: hypothetical protein IJ349_04075 [Clostridia bacterium]|nr:hypothetical protein [Clostridia bacterium]